MVKQRSNIYLSNETIRFLIESIKLLADDKEILEEEKSRAFEQEKRLLFKKKDKHSSIAGGAGLFTIFCSIGAASGLGMIQLVIAIISAIISIISAIITGEDKKEIEEERKKFKLYYHDLKLAEITQVLRCLKDILERDSQNKIAYNIDKEDIITLGTLVRNGSIEDISKRLHLEESMTLKVVDELNITLNRGEQTHGMVNEENLHIPRIRPINNEDYLPSGYDGQRRTQ